MNQYLIEFTSQDPERLAAGFDVCLAISTLDLPLDIIVSDADLMIKCKSLTDFELAQVYDRVTLNEKKYQTLKQNAKFFLEF